MLQQQKRAIHQYCLGTLCDKDNVLGIIKYEKEALPFEVGLGHSMIYLFCDMILNIFSDFEYCNVINVVFSCF